jgi:hypothetical protein
LKRDARPLLLPSVTCFKLMQDWDCCMISISKYAKACAVEVACRQSQKVWKGDGGSTASNQQHDLLICAFSWEKDTLQYL